MLAFAFGENGGIIDAECLEYKGEAIKSMAEKIQSPGIAITESIIGAILLLVGVEVSMTVYLCRELYHIRLLPCCRSDSEGVRRYRSICQLYGSCSRYPNPVKHILMMLSGYFLVKHAAPCQYNELVLTFGNRQDLIASVLTVSTRITDHNTFSELLWTRNPFSANSYVLLPRFQRKASLFSGALVEILKDTRALQAIRDTV
jgi:hypothetical protein